VTFRSAGRSTPRYAVLLAAIAVGVFFATSVFTFTRAEGASYLSDDPAACANCHIMNTQFDAWQRGPHQHVAVCNDCHTASGFVGKYASKAVNGFNHSFAFTVGNFHEPIQIKAFNRQIVENSCRSCHGELMLGSHGFVATMDDVSCTRCHADIGH